MKCSIAVVGIFEVNLVAVLKLVELAFCIRPVISVLSCYNLNFNLEQDTLGFSMKAKVDFGNLRLHAFGDRFRFTTEHPDLSPQAQIGIFLNSNLQWHPEHAILNIEGGKLEADEPTFDGSSMHCLWALRNRLHARRVVKQKLCLLGIVNSEYNDFIGHFIFSAAKASFEARSNGVVGVVEINQPRILSGDDQ